MRADEQLYPKHVGKRDSRRVLGLTGEARYRDFRKRWQRFSYQLELDRRIALPLLRDDLLVAFHQHVFRPVTAARGVVADIRHVDDDAVMSLRYDLFLRLLRSSRRRLFSGSRRILRFL